MTKQGKLNQFVDLSMDEEPKSICPWLKAEKIVDECGEEVLVFVPDNEDFSEWKDEWIEMWEFLKDEWGEFKGYPRVRTHFKEGNGGDLTGIVVIASNASLNRDLFD